MIKQIVFVLLIAVILAQDLCPQKLIIECEKDAELGTHCSIQPINHVKRQLRKKELIKLLISTVSSISSVPGKIAGHASA